MNDLLPLLQQLIACPSITPHDAGCQTIIREYLMGAGFKCESLRFGEVDNLWARFGEQHPLIVFAGHTDVVATGPLEDWASPPFQPDIRDGHLFGRGACDMKGNLACSIITAIRFIQHYPNFKGSIAFLITSDEEGLAINGTQKVIEVLEQRNEKIDYCIVGEPSSDSFVGDQVRIGRRGSLHGSLVVHGKQGHVAHPHLAINPIHLAMPALHEIEQTVWDNGNENFPRTTFQITNLHSGTGATNVIPGHLTALFNFRFSTAVTVSELQERTQAILHNHGLTYDLKWTIGGLPFLTDKGVLVIATQLAIKDVTGLEVKLSTGGGTSDGRFIAPTGAKVIELGVPHTTAHQVNECVRLDDLDTLLKIYYKLLKILLHISD